MADATIMFTGDLILDEPEPDSFFDEVRGVLQRADAVVGHVEVPHTHRGQPQGFDVPAPPSAPAHLNALGRAHFRVATLAGNHIADAGPNGITDTVETLRGLGIATVGAGMTLDEARRPAIVEEGGLRLGVLSYNCVGPRESWASASRPGCAYVHILTHYELDHASPGGPPVVYTFAEPTTLAAMEQDIADVRSRVDVLAVALHKGIGHTPAVVAMYERQVARAAVDAGADIVVGHHAHILRGIEIYKGRPVFHGLGNFVTVTRALDVEQNPSPERRAWAQRRRELFGFEPDPTYPTYPFHPEARNAMIAVCTAGPGDLRAGFVPCWIEPSGRPVPIGRSARGEAIADYVRAINERAALNGRLEWDGDVVTVR
jgi:poly-gamma-glutamate capsule biosynthesis protein CapA/YwtB (metallophosphatase superfamily)